MMPSIGFASDKESPEYNFCKEFGAQYNDKIQLSQFQAQLVGSAIRSRAPRCRFLVFGVGHDSALWLSLNRDGETLFVESSMEWAKAIADNIPEISIFLFSDQTFTVANSLHLCEADLKNFPPPKEIADQLWDVILVDGPPGHSPQDPGRALSIYWASLLARHSTHVFVDDYERELEGRFSDMFLRTRNTASYIIPASDRTQYRKLFWSAGAPLPRRAGKAPAVLSIATSDYIRKWRFCIDSQHRYCREHSFEHYVIDADTSGLHPKWMKLRVAIDLLEAGRDVFLIDADAEIVRDCPPFTQLLSERPQSDILFARGLSGRPNSGVLILRGGQTSIAVEFLKECLARKSEAVPSSDFVTHEGENGHVIWLLKLPRYAGRSSEIISKWNCCDPSECQSAFVRHYTNKLRSWYEAQKS
jgi:Polysaccharide biosynthesis